MRLYSFLSLIAAGGLISMSSTQGAPLLENAACSPLSSNDFSDVLACYRQMIQAHPLHYKITGEESLSGVQRRTYHMISQTWSPQGLVKPVQWEHEVTIYIPANVIGRRALLVLNNGTRHGDATHEPTGPTYLKTPTLIAIANATSTIVISVSDVPNQHLTFQEEGTPRKEDDSVARSWALFLAAPAQRPTMSLHVPMAAVVWQTMTLAQRQLKSWHINYFILTGASKRGWATWLAASTDPRIDAIAPFVFDLLGTKAGLKHIYKTYGNNWPIAFAPYYQAHIDRQIGTPPFDLLMQIEDPLQYIHSRYGGRRSLSKYIINASGDEFFVPDNSRFYYDLLPGAKTLRVVPNLSHYGISAFTEQSLIAFVNRIQRSQPLPKVDAKRVESSRSLHLQVRFSEYPVSVTLWTATNPTARDFRYACGIRYMPTTLPLNVNLGLDVPLTSPTRGWQAAFVEATFHDGFVATSQVYITPDEVFPTAAPLAGDANCRTLPGRD
jgi:PhoPQ-activated pathogenicity-related protein